MQLNTRIKSAVFDGTANEWMVKTDGGEEIHARYCVMAAGNLSTPRVPDFKGLKSFKGKWYHSGLWPHEGVDFSGLRVGVIGTGSSGVQMIPLIAEQAKHLTVFQRTANFSLPARNGPMPEEKRERKHKAEYPARRRGRRTTRPSPSPAIPSRPSRRSRSRRRNATRPTRPSGRKAARSATSMPTPTCW